MLALVTIALTPLGVIALLASLHASQTADFQRRAELRVAVTEGTRKLAAELGSDLTAATAAANDAESGVAGENPCARLSIALHDPSRLTMGYVVFAPDRSIACATNGYRPSPPPRAMLNAQSGILLTDTGADVFVTSRNGTTATMLHYPAAAIADFVRPIGLAVPYSLAVGDKTHDLQLARRETSFLALSESADAPVGLLGLTLRMSVAREPLSATEALRTFLPLLMLAAAAALGFFVVDRLLIRPLKQLRSVVANFRPGARFEVPHFRTPALEIRELAETFGQFGDVLALHEAKLAAALADQTRLTREVHHRVKNNLQVIASLISLHARGAPEGAVADAYASIQRRVDALAIVHRNHFAALETHQGVSVKALIGELASNFRAASDRQARATRILVSADAVSVSQDAAIPIAFLLTELIELSTRIDPSAVLTIGATNTVEPKQGNLSVQSDALRASADLGRLTAESYGRIIEGLARQLRAPLAHDAALGKFSIVFQCIPVN